MANVGEISELTLAELNEVSGGCGDLYACGVSAGRYVANRLEDLWDWFAQMEERGYKK